MPTQTSIPTASRTATPILTQTLTLTPTPPATEIPTSTPTVTITPTDTPTPTETQSPFPLPPDFRSMTPTFTWSTNFEYRSNVFSRTDIYPHTSFTYIDDPTGSDRGTVFSGEITAANTNYRDGRQRSYPHKDINFREGSAYGAVEVYLYGGIQPDINSNPNAGVSLLSLFKQGPPTYEYATGINIVKK